MKLSIQLILSLFLCCTKSDAQLISCLDNPCQNGGTCINQPSLTIGYRCICPVEYNGLNCQAKSNFNNGLISGSGQKGIINNQPYISSIGNDKYCLNGGTFVKDGLPCSCSFGFTGTRCETPILNKQYCLPSTCLNFGICIENQFGYSCSCTRGFYGDKCQYSKSSIRRTTGIPSFFSLLVIIGIIALVLYCCCYKPKSSQAPNQLNFMPGSYPQPFQGPNQYVPRTVPYPNATPMPFSTQVPVPGSYPGNFQMNSQNFQRHYPDPDEVFRTNQAPPPSYEEVQKRETNKS